MRATPTPPFFSRERIERLLDQMRGRRIAVVGDVMLDRYLIGDTDRLSPEAPVPVVIIGERRTALGGAANVAANITAIGAECLLVGVVGDDQTGQTLRHELALAHLDDQRILTVAGRPTTSKTRVLARGQQIVRLDEEVDSPLGDGDLTRLSRAALDALADADALLLQDYNKGALGPELIQQAMTVARKRGIPVVVDPKFRQFFSYAGATLFKPNLRELESALGAAMDLRNSGALPEALGRLQVDNLLLTLGADGMTLVTKDGRVTVIPSIAREVYDVSGAGDTVTAWAGSALAGGASMLEAAHLANLAAGVEVSKAGVNTVSTAEVMAIHDEKYDQIGVLRREGLI